MATEKANNIETIKNRLVKNCSLNEDYVRSIVIVASPTMPCQSNGNANKDCMTKIKPKSRGALDFGDELALDTNMFPQTEHETTQETARANGAEKKKLLISNINTLAPTYNKLQASTNMCQSPGNVPPPEQVVASFSRICQSPLSTIVSPHTINSSIECNDSSDTNNTHLSVWELEKYKFGSISSSSNSSNSSKSSERNEVIALQVGNKTFWASKQNLVKRSALFAVLFGAEVLATNDNRPSGKTRDRPNEGDDENTKMIISDMSSNLPTANDKATNVSDASNPLQEKNIEFIVSDPETKEQDAPKKDKNGPKKHLTIADVSASIFLIGHNRYFVDRCPTMFSKVLEYIQTGVYHDDGTRTETDTYRMFFWNDKWIDPMKHTLERSHGDQSNFDWLPQMQFSWLQLWLGDISPKLQERLDFLSKFLDECLFYQLQELIPVIQNKITTSQKNFERMQTVVKRWMKWPKCLSPLFVPKYNSTDDDEERDLSWLDRDTTFGGIRRIPFSRIAFAVSKDNYCHFSTHFDAPKGYRWGSQADYLNEYQRRDLTGIRTWIHHGQGGWKEYEWKLVKKVAFIFRDTFACGRFVHSGMAVGDISHVYCLLQSQNEDLLEYDERRGIVQGFAGLVLLSDDIYAPSRESAEYKEFINSCSRAPDSPPANEYSPASKYLEPLNMTNGAIGTNNDRFNQHELLNTHSLPTQFNHLTQSHETIPAATLMQSKLVQTRYHSLDLLNKSMASPAELGNQTQFPKVEGTTMSETTMNTTKTREIKEDEAEGVLKTESQVNHTYNKNVPMNGEDVSGCNNMEGGNEPYYEPSPNFLEHVAEMTDEKTIAKIQEQYQLSKREVLISNGHVKSSTDGALFNLVSPIVLPTESSQVFTFNKLTQSIQQSPTLNWHVHPSVSQQRIKPLVTRRNTWGGYNSGMTSHFSPSQQSPLLQNSTQPGTMPFYSYFG